MEIKRFLSNIPIAVWIGLFCVIALIVILKKTECGEKENFVAWNNEEVVEGIPKALAKDDEFLNGLFQSIVSDDANKFNGDSFDNVDFKSTTTFEEETKGIIEYVLRRVNLKGNHRFVALDHVSTEKHTGINSQNNDIVNRFVVTLFIQEKNALNVHAYGSLISFQLVQIGQDAKIEKLHTVTDYFYQNVGQYEPHNRHDMLYRLENQFHLHKPWNTNEQQVMDEGTIEQLLSQWHKDLKTPQYKCFGNTGSSISPKTGGGFYEDQGSRWNTRISCEENQGVWDKPIKQDAECPFYKKNLNYSNRLGGKKLYTDQCEMPVGTKTIGYRFLSNDPIHKPWCYNCKIGADGMPGSAGPCCDEQYDKELYPNLVSPDYMFPSDELERMQFSRELSDRGLNWQKHPTSIKNIANPNQKQPVFNAIIGPGPGPVTLP